jgi:hypothetical protein
VTTSPYGYRVRVGSQFGTAGTSPISAVYARRVLLNNLCHYADVFGQVRIAWSASPRVGKGYLQPTTPTTVNVPYYIAASAPFPIAVRRNGQSYKLRVRIAGVSSDNTNAVRFRAVLAPVSSAGSLALNSEDYVFLTATTTSSTPGWLTGASQGSEAFTTMVALSAEQCASMQQTTGTLSDIAGTPVGVSQVLVSLQVYGQTANVAAVPRLHGVYAAEWVGD